MGAKHRAESEPTIMGTERNAMHTRRTLSGTLDLILKHGLEQNKLLFGKLLGRLQRLASDASAAFAVHAKVENLVEHAHNGGASRGRLNCRYFGN
jgi:hypothetical protein